MLTYATLYNQHINVEHFPPLEWFFFCEVQNRFEETWTLLGGSESFVDKAKKIEEFEVFANDQVRFLQTWRTTRWPGGNPLSFVLKDMTQRLVLRYEYLATEAKKRQKHLPVPCPTYPRDLSALSEVLWQLIIDDCGGEDHAAEKTGFHIYEGQRDLPVIPADPILRAFERTIKFPRLRPKTELEGKEGDDAWLLEQEMFPSFGDAFHQRFSLRLFYLGAVLAALNISPSFWKNTTMIEARFVYPILPSGVREDFLVPFEKLFEELRSAGVLNCFGEWLIKTQKVSFLRLERVFGTDKYELFENNLLFKALPLLLPLSFPWLPVATKEVREFEASSFPVGMKEIFVIAFPDERFASQNKLLEEGEWEQIKHWSEQEWSLGQTEIGVSQLRLLSLIMMKWWRALWSEGFLPPPSYRWVSFHQAIQQTNLSEIRGVIIQP